MDINRLCKGCFRELHEAGQICPFCGFDEKKYEAERNPEVLPLNTILRGAFIVGKCLGKGGFGITYICWHINLETVVAIKEFYPSGIVYRNTDSGSGYESASVSWTSSGSKEIYQKSLQSFLKEARILGTLHLPGIVDVHDCFEENNTVYLVMDYIQGGDLKAYIKGRGGKISEEETLKLLHPVIDSLHEVHQQNIIHRDISPDNILLNNKGEVILVDFGAARSVTAQAAGEQGKSMTVVLKPGYAPMEQYNAHGNQGPWTDVYALCATMYRMMTGTVLNDPSTRANTDDDEQIIRQTLNNNQVSRHTTDVLIKGLKLRYKDRYQSMQELENALYSEGNKTPVAKNRQPAEVQKSSGYHKNSSGVSGLSGKAKEKLIGIIFVAALLGIVVAVGALGIRKPKKLYTITLGSYEQDNNTSNGSEPIEWLVLDKQGSKALVVSKCALDVKPYNAELDEVTWETCDLRKWLNTEFYNKAFSAGEQKRIIETVVEAEDNEKNGTEAGNDTRDKVFLLSVSEAKNFFIDDKTRVCFSTKYAQAQGAWVGSVTEYCVWWLRTPGPDNLNATIIHFNGGVFADEVNCDDVSVRPALWINLET